MHEKRLLWWLPVAVGLVSILVGTLVLAGWAVDLPFLKSLYPAWVAMKANTALTFVLLGAAMAAAILSPSPAAILLVRCAALLVGLIGLFSLAEYIFAWNPGFDQWLFIEPATAVGTSHPGRMAPDTALCFVLVALALFLVCRARVTVLRCAVVALLGALIMVLGLSSLFAYATSDVGPFGFWGLTLMAAHTAALFVLLGLAVVRLAWPPGTAPWSLAGRTLLGLTVWTTMVAGSLIWGLHQQSHNALMESVVAARTNINKDITFRSWATSHGGVYVPPTERTPPNPYLQVEDRDVITTSGKRLTLMNPAYIIREIQQRFESYGIRSGIVSSRPINPANTPDAWQAKALRRFEEGAKELLEVNYLDGHPYLRLMLPFRVGQGCLKCHAAQGYKLGDLRGGISTAIPLAPFLARTNATQSALALGHAVIWLLGLTGLALFYRREFALDEESARAAAALRESEERFRIAAETSNDLIYEWDLHDGVQWSGRIDEMLGYEAMQFPRTLEGWQAALHPEDRDRVLAAVQDHLDGQAPYAEEFRIRRRDGDYRWWSARGDLVRNADGTPSRWVGTVTDITERKEAEEERHRLETQLRQAQKMEAIGTLAGGIAHDFNNILSIIFGYTELALLEEDEEKRRQHLAELKKGAVRAKELVGQILTFSRKAEQQVRPLQISLIVKEALKMLRASIPSTIEIRQEITSEARVLADPSQIHQVVMNLCTNAFHAMRETGGVLAVSLHAVWIGAEEYAYAGLEAGHYLRLEVSDTGSGIAPEIREKIFEPYFTTKKQGEGTGMGLAVVHGIVKGHHGHITVYSEPGQGTTFHVYLPRTEAEEVSFPEKTPPADLRGHGERILLVDDEEQIRRVLETVLTRNGYQVVVCAGGQEALAAFDREPDAFALVLTDMTMPSLTGVQLAQQLLARRPRLPIILCTGQSELINREKTMAMGITDYLAKPISLDDLLASVKSALVRGGD